MSTSFAFPSFPGAEKFSPEAIQASLRPMMYGAQAWAELGKKHFEDSRIATEAALKSMMGIKDPQTAVELIKTNAQQGLALASEQMRASADLGVSQFHAVLAATTARMPQPETFAPLAKGLKTGVDMAHTSLSSALDQVAPVVKKAPRKA